MKKLIFSLFLVAIAATNLSASDTKVDGIWYDFDSSTKTASVTYRGNYYSLYKNEYTGTVVIPETVTCNNTTYSVTTIGDDAFSGCTGLTSVVIGNSVTTIGTWAFRECTGLTSVTIGNSVTTIGQYAFDECSSLNRVYIPNSVTTIKYCAFLRCTSLTSFYVDAANTHYSSVDGVLFNYAKDTLIQYPIGNTRIEYTIPNSVKTIESFAFQSCTSLTSITIPESVTTIGSRAFYGCTSLPVIDNLRYADTYLVEAVDKTLSTYTIKDGTKWIGEFAFKGCSSLTSITIPNSVITIGDYAFNGCYSLTSVIIPNSVTTIGECAFFYCYGLTSVTIPNSVTTIGEMAFYDCSGLTSVTIGNSVTTIGEGVFRYCYSLKDVEVHWTSSDKLPIMGDYVFSEIADKIGPPAATLHVPAGTKSIYEVADQWKDFGRMLDDVTPPIADLNTLLNHKKTIINKFFHNGNLIIERKGIKYTATGQKVR